MMLHGSAFRPLRLLALLVHLLVPGLVGVADARHSLAPEGGLAHVESQSHDCDAPVHGEDCALLHFLRSAAILQQVPEIRLPVAIARGDDPVSPLPLPQRQVPLRLPRGPPLHS